MTLAPALALLVLLGALAWGVQWMRRRMPASTGGAATLRVVAHLTVGPQQRVVVVELDGPGGPVQLTLGVTPQHVRTLHVRPVSGATTASAQATGQARAAGPAQADYASVLRAAQAQAADDGAGAQR
ncbi:FliO/MopB family protein [Tepidimonas charontis]|nr:flagellar biosynthetic protein FliO [Tepidimonas charontis]